MNSYSNPGHQTSRNCYKPIKWCAFLFNAKIVYTARWRLFATPDYLGSVQVALFLFIMIVNIVISNLLVGLTVSETDKIFNKAGILRLKRTVSQIVAIDLVQGGRTWQKCFRCFETNKKRKLFSYLHSLLTKDVSNVDKTPSAWKICVLPNSRIHEGSKERRVLDIHGGDANSVSLGKFI